MSFPTGWASSSALTVQHGQVTANQTAFPVLITEATFTTNCPEILTTGDPHAAQSDGGDLRFSTDSAGTTQIACEVVLWSQNATFSSARAEIWVPRDILTGSDVVIYVWWEAGGGQTQPAAGASFGSQAVWDANFGMVAHLPNGSSLTANDSTSHAVNGTVTSATATAGKIDGGAAFVAANSAQIDFGVVNIGLTTITVEAWFKASSAVGTFFTQWADSPATEEAMILDQNGGSGKARYLIGTVGTAGGGGNGLTNICDGNWHYIVLAWPTATNTLTGYLDGAVDNTFTTAGTVIHAAAITHLFLGRYSNGAFFTGSGDELRISGSVRSATWISTCYNNQNAPGSFIIAGTRQSHGTTSSLFRVGLNISGIGTGGPFFSNPLN